MKTIIAGSRTITDYEIVHNVISISGFKITEVVSGGASGVDSLGEEYARRKHIPVSLFLANWDEYGKAAGPIRNGMMADYAHSLIAIWDGESRGTQDMIIKAHKKGLKVYVHLIKGSS